MYNPEVSLNFYCMSNCISPHNTWNKILFSCSVLIHQAMDHWVHLSMYSGGFCPKGSCALSNVWQQQQNILGNGSEPVRRVSAVISGVPGIIEHWKRLPRDVGESQYPEVLKKKKKQMWHINGHGGIWLELVLDDLVGFFQPQWSHDSMIWCGHSFQKDQTFKRGRRDV